MEPVIEINSTRIAAQFVTCAPCGKTWRALQRARCPRCEKAYGIPYHLSGWNISRLMEALNEFENGEWTRNRFHQVMGMCYRSDNPQFIQIYWTYLREHYDQPLHIQRAMEIMEADFQQRVIFVDENGNPPQQNVLVG